MKELLKLLDRYTWWTSFFWFALFEGWWYTMNIFLWRLARGARSFAFSRLSWSCLVEVYATQKLLRTRLLSLLLIDSVSFVPIYQETKGKNRMTSRELFWFIFQMDQYCAVLSCALFSDSIHSHVNTQFWFHLRMELKLSSLPNSASYNLNKWSDLFPSLLLLIVHYSITCIHSFMLPSYKAIKLLC